ncbi:hypothetical protein [Capnocytophaga cynodegmi]|uniref:Uncharacterized protein n=1 Tax=Capnocytophaga cynodegmi TaxID=28189 RepID=A0A0B7HQI9_9FLAO|nr:hypothetical protein [Capnocytophaga cynodegmi]CEN39191.1 hypothetical protein CCYN74_330008 [Capnocytophaga cynodegmi]CEN40894.1 hypothetical protein CCYN49044_400008 [Capnocytophaga cynodegmi]
MENKSTYYQGYDFSLLVVFEWIKHGALEHINAKNWLEKSDFERCTNIFEKQFSDNYKQVKPFINNDLDKRNKSPQYKEFPRLKQGFYFF